MPRVVLITGASSGIGYAAALAFARRGDHVAATARRVEKLAELRAAVDALPAPHGEILTLAADVRDADAMRAAVADTVARFGRLDVLVANAGLGQRGSIADSAWDDLDTLMRTNMDGVLHSIRAAVPALRQAGGGQIVIISSVVANMVTPFAATYAATKAFVSSLARALRWELAQDDIGVTDMRVGRTQTEFNAKRLGESGRSARATRIPEMTAEQVAAAIVRAVDRRQKTVVLRPFDRLLIVANLLIPDVIGRLAMRQYRTRERG